MQIFITLNIYNMCQGFNITDHLTQFINFKTGVKVSISEIGLDNATFHMKSY